MKQKINTILLVSVAFCALQAQAGRVESTNVAVSAPLNLVNRSFARLQRQVEGSLVTERLSYRAQVASGNPEQVRELLLNLSGGVREAQIKNLIQVDAMNVPAAIDAFINQDSAVSTERFQAATKAALARNDVRLFSAQVTEKTGESRVLVVSDEETHELIVLTIARREI